MKYYQVTGGVIYTADCECPNCDGHTVNTTIDQVVESPNDTRTYVDTHALIQAGVPAESDWEYGPRIEDVTLATVERQALADWNLHLPVKHSLALAQARGEL